MLLTSMLTLLYKCLIPMQSLFWSSFFIEKKINQYLPGRVEQYFDESLMGSLNRGFSKLTINRLSLQFQEEGTACDVHFLKLFIIGEYEDKCYADILNFSPESDNSTDITLFVFLKSSSRQLHIFKVNYRNTRTRCEICSRKIPGWCQWRRSGVFVVNFEYISHLVLVFLLLTLRR